MKKRPDCIRHFSEIQGEPGRYPASDELLSVGAPFGKTFGLKRLGIHHETLRPGRRTSYPHAESTEEEFVYVIQGNPDAWIDGEIYPLGPGDGVGFVPGTGISHTFINNTQSDVQLLVVGDTTRADNLCYYPLNPERKPQMGGMFWENPPEQKMGPHDGRPDKRG